MTKEQMKALGLTEESKAREIMLGVVFNVFASAEIGSYMTLYGPERAVVSAKEAAKILKWTEYRTRKAIRELVRRGWIERATCGRPAVESFGEYRELVCEAMPPLNGYAITPEGFMTDHWLLAYDEWCRSMEEWANGKEGEE